MQVGVAWKNGKEVPGLELAPAGSTTNPASSPATTPTTGKAASSTTLSFDVFCGPKKRDLFVDPDALGSEPLYQKLSYIHLLNTQSTSCCSFCAFEWLTLGMMWLLQKLSIVAFGNYGVAIMLLVLMVRVCLHPLTKRGQISMSKMSKFGPALQELQKKYADDKETLQKETMKFYKTHGATPLLGCSDVSPDAHLDRLVDGPVGHGRTAPCSLPALLADGYGRTGPSYHLAHANSALGHHVA